jgi:hypothetical protein
VAGVWVLQLGVVTLAGLVGNVLLLLVACLVLPVLSTSLSCMAVVWGLLMGNALLLDVVTSTGLMGNVLLVVVLCRVVVVMLPVISTSLIVVRVAVV